MSGVKRKRVVTTIALLAAVLTALMLRTPIRIRLYDRAFAQVTRGMTESQVVELMGQPKRIDSGADTASWDDEALPQSVAGGVRREHWYTVRTFFLPISWTVGFDESGVVVSKHRWD
jgi:hypothetical protein